MRKWESATFEKIQMKTTNKSGPRCGTNRMGSFNHIGPSDERELVFLVEKMEKTLSRETMKENTLRAP